MVSVRSSVGRIDTGATVNWAHQAARVCDDIAVTADLIELARAGDGEAFRQLVGPYQRELQVHCYRMMGSVQDAEDAMQDALLAAWQGLSGFEGRASVRTWLYRIVTTRCLNARRSAHRRQGTIPPPGPQPPRSRAARTVAAPIPLVPPTTTTRWPARFSRAASDSSRVPVF